MKISTIKYFILSLTLIFTACYTPRPCITPNNSIEIYIKPVITLDSSLPVLYSADFEVMKYHFSGLIAFRKMLENNETRIVFLTETGIRMMEFQYSNKKIVNTFCIDAMKKRRMMRFTGSLIQLLLIQPECKRLCTIENNTKNNFFCKTKNGYYTCRLNNGVKDYIRLYNGRKKQIEAHYVHSSGLPDDIDLIMPMNTAIQMKKVDNAFK